MEWTINFSYIALYKKISCFKNVNKTFFYIWNILNNIKGIVEINIY